MTGMLLAQGSEGHKWINRLPGSDQDGGGDDDMGGCKNASETSLGGGKEGGSLWWCAGGVTGASLFERECDKAAKMIGRLFDAPQLE